MTANKALLASDGTALHKAARANGADLYYEAAVAGAIPLLRALRESLAGDTVLRVLGIVNGTTNFVLDRMDSSGSDFGAALAQAQELGYAEADPTADVQGHDAAAKAAILASLAFHTQVTSADVSTSGITEHHRRRHRERASARVRHQAAGDLRALRQRRLGSGASGDAAENASARSRPRAYNAVFVEAEAAGRLMFYGAGAGGQPTASAVLGDIVAVARNLRAGLRGPDPTTYAELPVVPMAEALTRYYVALDVADRPGVLGAGRGELRPSRRVDQGRAPGRPGRGRQPDHRHPHRARVRAGRDRRAIWRRWSPCAPSTACSASRARRASEALARRDR